MTIKTDSKLKEINDRRGPVFGRIVKGFQFSDEEYAEICRAHGKRLESETEKAAEPTFLKDRFLTFLASDETVDSYGDILRVDGCDLTRFKSGASAFITSHDIRDVSGSSGIIVKAWKAKNVEGSPDGKAIFVTVYFPTAEEDPDADYIFKKYKAGTLKAVSVGLQVLEYYEPKDDAERKRLGLGKWGFEVRKWMPYELSAVTVGANPNALLRKSMDENTVQTILKSLEVILNKIESNTPKASEAKPEAKLRCYLDEVPVSVEIKV